MISNKTASNGNVLTIEALEKAQELLENNIIDFKEELFKKFFSDLKGDIDDFCLIMPEREYPKFFKELSWVVVSKYVDLPTAINTNIEINPYKPYKI